MSRTVCMISFYILRSSSPRCPETVTLRASHSFVFSDVMGQPHCEFVLNTVPMVEHLPYVQRTIQAFLVSLTRLSLCLYLAFIIRIDKIANSSQLGLLGKGVNAIGVAAEFVG